MRGLLTCSVLAALVPLAGCSKPEPPPPTRPGHHAVPMSARMVPDDVVGAWKKRGAGLRMMTISTGGDLVNVEWTGQLRGEEMPAFQFAMYTQPDLANLPPVPVPFGISLFSAHTTDDDLKHLVGLRNLKRLELTFTKITDKGLAHLGQMTELERLVLRETQTNPANVQKLQASLPDCKIER